VRIDEFTEIAYTLDEGVAHIVLNHPERRNAWGETMALQYRWALHHADNDPAVRVVVLSGAGDHFCVGAERQLLLDIEGRNGSYHVKKVDRPPYPEGTPPELRRNHLAPLSLSVPVIAAIRGGCAGVGFVLATYADIRFVGHNSRISSSFAKLGLPAEFGIAWILPRIMGLPNAAQILYFADIISGAEATRLGWAQGVFDDDEVVNQALTAARRLARSSSGESLRSMKQQLFRDMTAGLDEVYRRSVDDMKAALTHPDFGEGIRAQRDRRPPDFLNQSQD
jgi:enoyl-CoA hydratase/carnithine racemase